MIEIGKELITVTTKNTTYQMKVGDYGVLLHLYYGAKLQENDDMSYAIDFQEHGFSGVPYEAMNRRNFSLDTLPQEFSSFGVGDYRIPALSIKYANGSRAVDLRFSHAEKIDSKVNIEGLPSLKGEGETLKVYLKDVCEDVGVVLIYGVLEEFDVITRSVEVINNTENEIYLDEVMSVSLDCPRDEYEVLHFHGCHVLERQLKKTKIDEGIFSIGSTRNSSSHHHNPFVILTKPNTTEDFGECLSFSFVYSGDFIFRAEKDYLGQLRVQMGIHPQNFGYILKPQESFFTPEVAMCYTNKGLNEHTFLWTNAVRKYIINERYQNNYCPILINNWEATYMDFTEEKLYTIAVEAKKLGIEMFVLDDGWFGNRNDDCTSLGDWYVNCKKLPNGLESFIQKLSLLDLKFGLWVEPEMISEDSDLFRKHPDWVLKMPHRKPNRSRNQFVLNLGLKEVEDYLYKSLEKLLKQYSISYLKWDMNRSICDLYNPKLGEDGQQMVAHQYVLGLYSLLNRITSQFNVRIESCSGGGGRMDLGMLYYTPQVWCSDNTDPMDRLGIQYGTSFGYPVMTMGSHVSASPNHQTGRSTPLQTRGYVAFQGTFGFELDLSILSLEEKEIISQQIVEFKRDRDIIYNARVFRLISPYEDKPYTATQYVAEEDVLIYFIFKRLDAVRPTIYLKLKGLDEKAKYQYQNLVYSGAQLMNQGIKIPYIPFDYGSHRIILKKIKE